MVTFTFSTSKERLDYIREVVKKNIYPDVSTYINDSLDLRKKQLETKRSIAFMYFICIPLGLFLGTLGLSMHLASLFFYILSVIFGMYLVVFVFLFYKEHMGGIRA